MSAVVVIVIIPSSTVDKQSLCFGPIESNLSVKKPTKMIYRCEIDGCSEQTENWGPGEKVGHRRIVSFTTTWEHKEDERTVRVTLTKVTPPVGGDCISCISRAVVLPEDSENWPDDWTHFITFYDLRKLLAAVTNQAGQLDLTPKPSSPYGYTRMIATRSKAAAGSKTTESSVAMGSETTWWKQDELPTMVFSVRSKIRVVKWTKEVMVNAILTYILAYVEARVDDGVI